MAQNIINRPPQVVPGFVDGLIKQFPESTRHRVGTTVSSAERFLKRTGELLAKIENVRKTQKDDPTITDTGRAVHTFRYAEDKKKEIKSMYGKVRGTLKAKAREIEHSINKSIEDGAKTGRFAREARDKISAMPKEERVQFISRAINEGNIKIARYIFGAPAFFSGINEASHSKLKEQFKRKIFAEEMETIKQLNKLDEAIEKGFKGTLQEIGKLRARASSGGALEKARKAQEALNM